MNFLHVIPSLDSINGGTVEGLKQLGAALMELGHGVDVVTLDAPDMPYLLEHPFTKVIALGPAKLSYRYSARLIPWLKQNASNYDSVMIEGLWQFHSFATWRALRQMDIPYFVFTHGMLSPWFKKAYPLKHLKKWLYWPWAEYQVLRHAKAVLFTSDEERLLSRESFWLYRCREAVVGYGTVRSSGDPDAQRAKFLASYPGLRGQRIFLFLSRIHEKKGCDLLVAAFAKVAARDANLRLVMAGPDQTGWKEALVALAERIGVAEKIVWTGMISGDMKWGAYHAAEVFALPSHQENFGVVVAEALSCGLPVLVSNKVNIWREVEAEGAGIIAEDDLAGTETLLTRWLDMDEGSRSVMRERSLECFDRHFEISRTAERLLRLVMKGPRQS
ncbi:MAG: transferase [Deltaproteobacteria bacterium RIFCSPLOWO2_02_FULL_53_8]|nr:MAG: transferase [Deltaproteobacteria bacterium RIFCSPLOWO2_02_FULL_53_8]